MPESSASSVGCWHFRIRHVDAGIVPEGIIMIVCVCCSIRSSQMRVCYAISAVSLVFLTTSVAVDYAAVDITIILAV